MSSRISAFSRAWGVAVARERAEQRPDLRGVSVDRGVHEFVLGLEVVVDVADGHVGRVGDVGDRRLLDPLLVEPLARACDEPLAFARPLLGG